MKRWHLIFAAATALTCAAAQAEPLVTLEGDKAKPNVVTAWSGSETKIELTVKEGADPKAVAEAIQAGVPKVKASVKGGKVLVVGKTEADLLKALAGVDYGDEAFGALAAKSGDDQDPDSGSSLRAKKAADLDRLYADAASGALGKVVSVEQTQFPASIVTVQVLRGPTGALAKDVRKGAKIKFKPVLKMSGKAPDWSDEYTQVNTGAWFLRAGDQVRVKIGKGAADAYEAALIDRQ